MAYNNVRLDGGTDGATVTPADRYTRVRFHWVRKNDFEVWEWLRNGSWLRPGQPAPLTEDEAGRQGWAYVEPAINPR